MSFSPLAHFHNNFILHSSRNEIERIALVFHYKGFQSTLQQFADVCAGNPLISEQLHNRIDNIFVVLDDFDPKSSSASIDFEQIVLQEPFLKSWEENKESLLGVKCIFRGIKEDWSRLALFDFVVCCGHQAGVTVADLFLNGGHNVFGEKCRQEWREKRLFCILQQHPKQSDLHPNSGGYNQQNSINGNNYVNGLAAAPAGAANLGQHQVSREIPSVARTISDKRQHAKRFSEMIYAAMAASQWLATTSSGKEYQHIDIEKLFHSIDGIVASSKMESKK